jgi:hypothetical protein
LYTRVYGAFRFATKNSIISRPRYCMLNLQKLVASRGLPLFLPSILERPDLAKFVRLFSGNSFESQVLQIYRFAKYHKDIWEPQYYDRSVWTEHDVVRIQKAIKNVTARFDLAYLKYLTRPDETFVRRWSGKIFYSTSTSHASDSMTSLLYAIFQIWSRSTQTSAATIETSQPTASTSSFVSCRHQKSETKVLSWKNCRTWSYHLQTVNRESS